MHSTRRRFSLGTTCPSTLGAVLLLARLQYLLRPLGGILFKKNQVFFSYFLGKVWQQQCARCITVCTAPRCAQLELLYYCVPSVSLGYLPFLVLMAADEKLVYVILMSSVPAYSGRISFLTSLWLESEGKWSRQRFVISSAVLVTAHLSGEKFLAIVHK